MSVIGPELSLRYEIIEELGAGAFAHVYRAFDRTLKRCVAIKILRCSLDGPRAQRFQREVEICQRLRHKNIVRMFDANLSSEPPYIVLELLEGYPLDDLLADRPFTIKDALSCATDIASALEHLHGFGLLHRDIKPANIMIVEQGHAVLTDFNLSYDASATAISETGQIFGTPRYMAPELWDGECASEASDLYGLGLVLYEMLASREVLARCTENPRAIHTLEPLPERVRNEAPWLAQIVARATAIDPADRYPSAQDFISALREGPSTPKDDSLAVSAVSKASKSSTAPGSYRSALLPLVVIVLTLALCLFVVGDRSFLSNASTPEPSQPTVSTAPVTRSPQRPAKISTKHDTTTKEVERAFAAYRSTKDRRKLTAVYRLLTPLLYRQPAAEHVDEYVHYYLTCLAYRLDADARRRLARVIEHFINGPGATTIDLPRCVWRCAALLALAFEPEPSDLELAKTIVDRAIPSCPSLVLRTELRCLRSIFETRAVGGPSFPSPDQLQRAMAITKPLVSELVGKEPALSIARAMHVVNLSRAGQSAKAGTLLAQLHEDRFPHDKRWWFYNAHGWYLAAPRTRRASLEAYRKAEQAAPPELTWYFTMTIKGMDANRLLDSLFGQ